jgi:hypothetical protein
MLFKCECVTEQGWQTRMSALLKRVMRYCL